MADKFTWKTTRNPGLVISFLNSARTQKKGKVSYRAFEYEDLAVILLSCLDVPKGVNPEQARQFLGTALGKTIPNGRLSTQQILHDTNAAMSAYFGQQPTDYCLVSSLSYTGDPPQRWTSAGRCRVYLKINAQKFCGVDGRPRLTKKLPGLEVPEQRRSYPYVVVRTSGRSPHDAFTDGMAALDQVRGLLNLSLNSGQRFRLSFGARQPVNALRLGKMHSLHNLDGSLAIDRFWYEPEFIEPINLADLSRHQKKLSRFMREVQRNLRGSKLAPYALDGLVRYTRALDRRDWSASFQELWMTLEFLTNTMRSSYDVTIRRAAALFSDYEFTLEMTKHLRGRRNEIVHGVAEHPEIEILLFQLKRIVEHHLLFYIRNPCGLHSREEVGQLLDLPIDADSLRRTRQLVDSALKLHLGK